MKRVNVRGLLFTVILIASSIIFTYVHASERTHINILMPAPFDDATKELVKKYNRSNKSNVYLKVTRGPRETESVSDLAISSLLLGQSQYDSVLIDVTWLPKYAEAKWLSPLDSWFDQNEFNKIEKGAKRGNRYRGELYRWPFVADMGLLYWRTDLMNNPPKSANDLISISKDLQGRSKIKYGYVWQGRQYEGLSCVFVELISGFGGEWITNNGQVKLNSIENKEAIRWLRTLIKEGVSPIAVTNFSEPEALQSFKSGESAFMRNWPYAWNELQKDDSYVKGKVGVTTMISSPPNNPTATLGSWGFSIMNSSPHPKETAEVIKYLTSNESQKFLYNNYGYTPTTSNVYQDPDLEGSTQLLIQLKQGLDISKPRPMIANYAQVSNILQRHLSSILTTDVDIDKELDEAQERTTEILNSTGSRS